MAPPGPRLSLPFPPRVSFRLSRSLLCFAVLDSLLQRRLCSTPPSLTTLHPSTTICASPPAHHRTSVCIAVVHARPVAPWVSPEPVAPAAARRDWAWFPRAGIAPAPAAFNARRRTRRRRRARRSNSVWSGQQLRQHLPPHLLRRVVQHTDLPSPPSHDLPPCDVWLRCWTGVSSCRRLPASSIDPSAPTPRIASAWRVRQNIARGAGA